MTYAFPFVPGSALSQKNTLLCLCPATPHTADCFYKIIPLITAGWLGNFWELRYNFTVVKPRAGPDAELSLLKAGYATPWCKLPVVNRVLSDRIAEAEGGCHWVMIVDADAIIREHHVGIDGLISQIAREESVDSQDLSVVVGAETKHAFPNTTGPELTKLGRIGGVHFGTINTGVVFFKVNAFSQNFIKQWLSDARNASMSQCEPYKSEHPWEQICGEGLFRRSSPKQVHIAQSTQFNTPHGRFVSHLWNGYGGDDTKHWDHRWADRVEDAYRVNGYFAHQDRVRLWEQVEAHQADIIC